MCVWEERGFEVVVRKKKRVETLGGEREKIGCARKRLVAQVQGRAVKTFGALGQREPTSACA